MDNLQQLQTTSNDLAVKAVTGNLDDIHTPPSPPPARRSPWSWSPPIRNKGVDAFNEIMRMQA